MSNLAFSLMRDPASEPFAYHDASRRGFSAICTRTLGGEWCQDSIPLSGLADALREVNSANDAWVSQCEFSRANRRIVHLWRIGLAFLDLDTYKVSELKGLPAESLCAKLLDYCDGHNIPEPSIVVFSGRGLQCKWLFEEPIPAAAISRWQAVQSALCALLEKWFGADPGSMDASRVLRIVGTTNLKNGNIVRLLHTAGNPSMGGVLLANGLVGYPFDVFADTILPLERRSLEALRTERKAKPPVVNARKAGLQAKKHNKGKPGAASFISAYPNLRRLDRRQLAWDRLADIRKVAELRGWTAGVPEGRRDIPIFLASCFLSQAVSNVPEFEAEVWELTQEFAPSWKRGQVQSCVVSVTRRMREALAGKLVEFDGKSVDPRYWWRNTTLIKLLQITAAEQTQLKTIISTAEKNARASERKKVQRASPRPDWLDSHRAKRNAAEQLRATGMTYRAIAMELGYRTQDAARKAIAKARSEVVTGRFHT
jgi:hypothetical protein